MAVCFVCDTVFLDNKALMSHYAVFHPFLNVYRCCDNNCRRSFSTLTSFRKHRQRFHVQRKSQHDSFEQEKAVQNINVPASMEIDCGETKAFYDSCYSDKIPSSESDSNGDLSLDEHEIDNELSESSVTVSKQFSDAMTD